MYNTFGTTLMLRSLLAPIAIAALVILAPAAPRPAVAQDASESVVRLNRLESEIRRLNGRIEELEQQNRQLAEQVKRFQEDVEFRLSGGKPPAGTPVAAAAPAAKPPGDTPAAPAVPAVPRPGRGDAFDPDKAPQAPGAPRPLGATPPPPAAPARPAVAATGDARSDFDVAFGFIQRNELEAAEIGFRQFLTNHPKSDLRASATYWLGESFFRRRMHREAAEQFLKVSTDFARSANAAQGLLRLGQSLAALGAGEQACATFREIGKRFPNAGAAFKKDVEREVGKAKCPAA
jgi:tol-pal system protein YbgF